MNQAKLMLHPPTPGSVTKLSKSVSYWISSYIKKDLKGLLRMWVEDKMYYSGIFQERLKRTRIKTYYCMGRKHKCRLLQCGPFSQDV